MAKKNAAKKAAKSATRKTAANKGKKASKPAAKKAASKSVKKAAPKKAVKKAAPKKAAKPASKGSSLKKGVTKKATPKKIAKKAAPKAAKKASPKKAARKVIAKKPASKKAVTKPVKKSAPVKAKATSKKVAPKKATAARPAAPKGGQVKKAGAPGKKAPMPAPAPKSTKKETATTKQASSKAAGDLRKSETKPPARTVEPKTRTTSTVKKDVKKKEDAEETSPRSNGKPLVTQVATPNRPVAAPVVKKQVSTLESADKLRYSDEELEEFRDIINKKLDEARRDYDLLKQTLANTDNNGTDDTSPSFKMIEDGSETLSREETAQLAGRQEKFIKHLEDALLRIRNKTYGICRVTGRLISKERLRLVPHATLSIEAKQQMNG